MNKSFLLILQFVLLTKIFASDTNELPMYGNVNKSESQIAADKKFILLMLEKTGNLKEASRKASKRGWEFIRSNDFSTAIKRLNQAWLLDSTNAETYWGFAVYVGQQGKTDESVQLMEKACKYDSLNGELWADLGFTYSRLGVNQKDKSQSAMFFNNAERSYEKSTALKPEYGYQYFQWAILKFYQEKYAEAWPLISTAEKLGVMDLDQRFLKDLESKVLNPT